MCKSVNIQLNCHSEISSFRAFKPLFVSQTACNPRSQSRYAVTMFTSVVLFSHVSLFIILPLESSLLWNPNLNVKSDNEAKKNCKFDTR
jgi:hypothetical protein